MQQFMTKKISPLDVHIFDSLSHLTRAKKNVLDARRPKTLASICINPLSHIPHTHYAYILEITESLTGIDPRGKIPSIKGLFFLA